jgi:hypothetical protein
MQPDTARARFWQWFMNNGDRLRAAMYGPDDDAREEAAAELREAVHTVQPGLVLELGHSAEGEPRQLIVSADGHPERVDAVKNFVAAAPALPGWDVVAFRPRLPIGESLEIVLQGERVGPDDISFRVTENDDGLDLTLHVRGLTAANEKLRGLGASLLAEHAVGERDALTMLNSLRIEPPAATRAPGLRPFRELAAVFDEAKAAKYPPPGSLPIDLENDWQNMRGTINGSTALVLLHAGLRPFAGHPDYDCRVTVSIPFHGVNEDGLPTTEEEYVTVCDLGDRLADAVGEGQQALLAMTIMTQGRRDLIFYTSDADATLERVEALRAEATTYEVEASVERDTFWGMYRNFCGAGRKAETEE